MGCTMNPNKNFLGFKKRKHKFEIFRVYYSSLVYQYNVHYKCKHCGIRWVKGNVAETREILDWIEQEKLAAKLKKNLRKTTCGEK